MTSMRRVATPATRSPRGQCPQSHSQHGTRLTLRQRIICADGRDPVDYPEITYDLTGLRSPRRPHWGSPHAGGCLACPGSSAPPRLYYWYGVPWVCHTTAQGKVLGCPPSGDGTLLCPA